jgi:cytochrome c
MKSVIFTLGAAALLVSGSAMADLDLAKKSGCLACHSPAPMPPYSPRVSDANIEKLVDFVLSLGK